MVTFYQAFPPTAIRGAMLEDLSEKQRTFTIKEVRKETAKRPDGKKEEVWHAYFEGRKLPFEVNKMNWKLIVACTGEKDSDNWPGHRITIACEADDSGLSDDGKCIRVVGSPELSESFTVTVKGAQGKREKRQLRPTVASAETQPAEPETVDGDEDGTFWGGDAT